MSADSGAVRFLYGTKPGRLLLQCILKSHADTLAVAFLSSGLSKPMIPGFIRRNGIDMAPFQGQKFGSYRAFFCRRRSATAFDAAPGHLISPCDGWLSAFPIGPDSVFTIKGSLYRVADLIPDPALERTFAGGQCLIFRLTPSDYHHYCYVDDGRQGENHFVPGALHSVQPAACAAYPVYTLNRRSWTVLDTRHFGAVVQCEIGALIVGGIVNPNANAPFRKGEEKGYFDLAGSSIALLLRPGAARLLPAIAGALEAVPEVRVAQGQWIASAPEKEAAV